ncbi:ankyrin repeat-containing domain protein [Dipodascopsis uninucleata]
MFANKKNSKSAEANSQIAKEDASSTDANTSDGAKPSELLLEASRRNNVDLLQEVLGINDNNREASPSTAELINSAVDPLGNTALHLAALNGSYECLDILLDIEGVEVEPVNRLEGNTPLHNAVIYSEEEPEHGFAVVEMLIDAGSDPRIRNKMKEKPIDLVHPTNPDLRRLLQGAELAINMAPSDTVEDNGQEGSSDDE